MIQDKPECIGCQYYNPKECFCDAIGGCVKSSVSVSRQSGRMKTNDRYCTSIWADEYTYVHDADYRDFITNRIQDDLARALITALCTKDAIIAIKGDSTIRKDEFRSGIICRQDVYIKNFVQCKDCKFYKQLDSDCPYCGEDGYYKEFPGEDDYCSKGERKE